MIDDQNHTDQVPNIYCRLLGISVTPMIKSQLVRSSTSLLVMERKALIVGHNLHSAYMFHTSREFKNLYQLADIILADGKPVETDARISMMLDKAKMPIQRLGTTDWIRDFLISMRDSRVAVVGARAESNSKFLEKMGSETSHEYHGFHGNNWNEREQSIVGELNEMKPDVVIVGLGMPLQENFLYKNWELLPSSLYILVGGAIDQLSGHQSLAPRWIGNLGFEWLWRLLTQPKRLASRYIAEPWKLVGVRLATILRKQENS